MMTKEEAKLIAAGISIGGSMPQIVGHWMLSALCAKHELVCVPDMAEFSDKYLVELLDLIGLGSSTVDPVPPEQVN